MKIQCSRAALAHHARVPHSHTMRARSCRTDTPGCRCHGHCSKSIAKGLASFQRRVCWPAGT